MARRTALRHQILSHFGRLLEIASRVDPKPPASDLGLHVWRHTWSLRRPRRRLVRIATYRLGSTPATRTFYPARGVGVVGLCWKRNEEEAIDVETLAKNPEALAIGQHWIMILDGFVAKREGFDVSLSTVGRILKSLMQRGVVQPIPALRRKPGGRRFRLIGKRHARRLPKGLKPSRPGEMVQVDTMFVSSAPGRARSTSSDLVGQLR
jgi:hypothetical protein